MPFGLWRSTDSGATWQLQNVPNPGAGGFGIQDLALDPTNSNILYAGVRTSGVWKSINAKAAVATFTRMGTGFPPVNSFVTFSRTISPTRGR